MKSIMEEASSITKAIDQAWNRAGKPAEFTIKILEHPERNMFGLTVKSAKIAFFFDERKSTITASPTTVEPKPKAVQPHRHEENRPKPQPQKVVEPVRQTPIAPKQEVPKQKNPTVEQQSPRAPRWNDQMVETATQWIAQALKIMNKSDIAFTSSVTGNNITFQFSGSITGNQNKDRLLFSGFANLIMATLRNKYKKSFRFNKVILIVT